MKHIIKVEVLENLPEIRPLIAMDKNKKFFAEGKKEPVVPNDEIWYTTTDGNKYDLASIILGLTSMGATYNGPAIVSNEYDAEKQMWCMAFDDDVTILGDVNANTMTAEGPIFATQTDMGLVCNVETIILPKTITRIGVGAFGGCASLTSISIPNSVTSVGVGAFYGCSSLTSVTIGNSVTSVGESAFYGCSSLTSVTIGNSVTSVEKMAFANCDSLTSVNIPNSVTSIGIDAFYGCSSLTSVTIGNGVSCIEEWAFYGCSSLTSVHITDLTSWCKIIFSSDDANPLHYAHNLYLNGELVKDLVIPNNVTSIGDYAFNECSSLTSVIIPNSVTSIGDDAFYDCSSLTSVTIGNSVTSIGESAFCYCSSLTSITIPNSVTSIGDWAFEGCETLTSATIGNSVSSIGRDVFQYCSSLTSVNIPNSVTSIGIDAFDGCSSLTSVHITDLAAWCNIDFGNESANPVYYIQNLYLNGELVKDLVIPNNVTSIGKHAFYRCKGLTSVNIPNSVTSIGKFAFAGCTSLTSVHITDLAAWCNIDFAEGNANPLHYAHNLYLNGELVKDLVIPNSITSIGDYAFVDCISLTSITIPNSVTSIGKNATSGCSSLNSVSIPNSVSSIGDYAFASCSSLTSVTCEPITPPALGGTNVFDRTNNCPMYVPADSADTYKTAENWSEYAFRIQAIQ